MSRHAVGAYQWIYAIIRPPEAELAADNWRGWRDWMRSDIFSRSRIYEFGGRLRTGVTDPDLRLLDEYRKSFCEDYDRVIEELRTRIGLELGGDRPSRPLLSLISLSVDRCVFPRCRTSLVAELL